MKKLLIISGTIGLILILTALVSGSITEPSMSSEENQSTKTSIISGKEQKIYFQKQDEPTPENENNISLENGDLVQVDKETWDA